jgi:D-glycero-alpha-D-manno-heptose-7-phosphate kinase
MKSGSKAPLRIGLAGGGTDVSPYCDLYGGEVLNAAISLYASCTVTDNDSLNFIFKHDQLDPITLSINEEPVFTDHVYDLHWGVVARIRKAFGKFETGLTIETLVDAPLGSGLGTSSTLVVSILGAVLHHLGIHLSKKELASLAFSIEREDLRHPGGRQDQYAACFGGINSIRFETNGEVIIEPIKASQRFIEFLRENLMLYYTSHSRYSGKIIEEQISHVKDKAHQPLEAMHLLKNQSGLMKLAFESENYSEIVQLIDAGFREKKKMASGITNERIEDIYSTAMKAGALAGKISGAGGGGFMVFCVPPDSVDKVREALLTFGGTAFSFHFDQQGLTTWSE